VIHHRLSIIKYLLLELTHNKLRGRDCGTLESLRSGVIGSRVTAYTHTKVSDCVPQVSCHV
jgi:hypothetical protein